MNVVRCLFDTQGRRSCWIFINRLDIDNGIARCGIRLKLYRLCECSTNDNKKEKQCFHLNRPDRGKTINWSFLNLIKRCSKLTGIHIYWIHVYSSLDSIIIVSSFHSISIVCASLIRRIHVLAFILFSKKFTRSRHG
jgi:hypothetical protein